MGRSKLSKTLISELKFNYLTRSRWGFVQQIIWLISHGYPLYSPMIYPEKKRENWEQIDLKLIEKYPINLSKFQRATRKRKGLKNFVFLRHEHRAFFFATEGEPDNAKIQDEFFHWKIKPLIIPVGQLQYQITPIRRNIPTNRESVTLKISLQDYRDLKDFFDTLCAGNVEKIIKEFDKLNGIPAWSGIQSQRKVLRDRILKDLKRRRKKIIRSKLRLQTRRKVYKVFSSDE